MGRDKYRIYTCIFIGSWGKFPSGTFISGNKRIKPVRGVADGHDRFDGDGPLVKKLKIGKKYLFKRIYDSRGGSHFHGPYPV